MTESALWRIHGEFANHLVLRAFPLELSGLCGIVRCICKAYLSVENLPADDHNRPGNRSEWLYGNRWHNTLGTDDTSNLCANFLPCGSSNSLLQKSQTRLQWPSNFWHIKGFISDIRCAFPFLLSLCSENIKGSHEMGHCIVTYFATFLFFQLSPQELIETVRGADSANASEGQVHGGFDESSLRKIKDIDGYGPLHYV